MVREIAGAGRPRILPVLPLGLCFPKMLSQVVAEADEHIAIGQLKDYRLMVTGFDPLDAVLGSGLRAGELILVGGRHGIGKTIFALQAARKIALSGVARCCYVCSDHNQDYLFDGLVCFERGESLPSAEAGLDLQALHHHVAWRRSLQTVGLNAILVKGRVTAAEMRLLGLYCIGSVLSVRLFWAKSRLHRKHIWRGWEA